MTSLCAVEALYATSPEMVKNCMATAGFSVGEITALIFTGAMSFEDGVRYSADPNTGLFQQGFNCDHSNTRLFWSGYQMNTGQKSSRFSFSFGVEDLVYSH